MDNTIEFKGEVYPKFQSIGNAMQFATPYALQVCKGRGIDVGCSKLEWCFGWGVHPVSFNDTHYFLAKTEETTVFAIDPTINNYNALDIPFNGLDFIISSHCLEHLDNWVAVLDYWRSKLKSGGVLFLYLPDFSQKYWRPWHNKKHKNIFTPEIIEEYMKDNGFSNIFKSGVDLNNSFMIYGYKI